MDTPRIRQVDPNAPDPAALTEAAETLTRGGLVVLPTETVYGLAADPRVPDAAGLLYRAKGRPSDKPFTFFASGLDQAESFGARPGKTGKALALAFWPGPLTLVFPSESGTVGFRVPDHPVPLLLLEKVEGLLMVTSANRSGDREPLSAGDALAMLGGSVDLALDAGPSPGGIPSTVVRVEGEQVDILRSGAIKDREILNVAEKA